MIENMVFELKVEFINIEFLDVVKCFFCKIKIIVIGVLGLVFLFGVVLFLIFFVILRKFVLICLVEVNFEVD